jgi:predicted transcriptional regulator
MIHLYRSFHCTLTLLILTICPAIADEKSTSFAELKEKVDRRVADWQPTADEKRFDQIGWCTSLLEAEKLAREHRRPIFLFTHDGRMNVGRC